MPAIKAPYLKSLNLSQNEVAESKLEGHPALESLALTTNKLTTTKGLGHMPRLIELNLAENLITSLEGLVDLPALKRLTLRQNEIAELPALELPALEFLDLSTNKIEKLDEVKKLKPLRITDFNMTENPVADEAGDGFKQEVLILWDFRKVTKINDEELEPEVYDETRELLKERIAEEEERKRQEEEERKALNN